MPPPKKKFLSIDLFFTGFNQPVSHSTNLLGWQPVSNENTDYCLHIGSNLYTVDIINVLYDKLLGYI